MRIILYTGKGGVGKTSVAAATALRCADLGYRTVVLSTDPAHSLGDSFDLPVGNEPTLISENLWAQEVDILHQMDRYWGQVQGYMASIFAWRGMDDVQAEETSVLPGMEELASLLQIVYLYDTDQYDTIIVDCAPTGATLQLLSFPEMARWYLEKVFPIEKRALRVARPIMRAVTNLPMPDDSFMDTLAILLQHLDRMHGLLTDPLLTTTRLVLNPEKMVIKEAQRAFTYLNLYNYSVDAVISNRALPDEVTHGYFATWKELQAKYRELVEEGFSPVPILDVPMFDREVVGLEMLRRMAEATYGLAGDKGGEGDPTRIFYAGQPQKVEQVDGSYRLILPLSFVSRERIELNRFGDELVVHIGNWKRNIVLPRALVKLEVQGAKYEQDTLVVSFGDTVKDATRAA